MWAGVGELSLIFSRSVGWRIEVGGGRGGGGGEAREAPTREVCVAYSVLCGPYCFAVDLKEGNLHNLQVYVICS